MDFQKKPLGTDTREPVEQPVTAQQPPVVQQPVVAERKYPRRRILAWRIIVTTLLIVATGLLVAGWFYVQDLYAQLEKKDSEIVQLQTAPTKEVPTSTNQDPPTDLTTQQLADQTIKTYKDAASGVSHFVRVEKVQGDFASIYLKAEVPNAEAATVILKKVGDQLVEIKRIGGAPVISKEEANLLMTVYGVDVKLLGITVE